MPKENWSPLIVGYFGERKETDRWQPAIGAPKQYAYVVQEGGGRFWAGFEDGGVWQARSPLGPWRLQGLDEQTVTDLVYEFRSG